jgi:hypothetical protein
MFDGRSPSTPALSPGERGWQRARLGNLEVVVPTAAVGQSRKKQRDNLMRRYCQNAANNSPSPGGEGQDEGGCSSIQQGIC